MRMLIFLTVFLAFAVTAQAQTPEVADFEGGVNNGDWTWGNSADVVESEGGNPDGFLHNASLDTYYPILRSGWDAEGWTGDYTTMGVTHISGVFQTFASSNQYIGEYYFTVLFRNHMGTPNDIEDDIFVYIDPYQYTAPGIDEGWISYGFDFPYDFVGAPGETPDGWEGGSYYSGNGTFPADALWHEVIADIGRVEFWFNHPDWGAIFANFDVGVDNIILEMDGGTVATEESTFGAMKALFR